MARGQGRQENRVAPGGEFGSRQELEAVQEASPLPDRREQLASAVQQAQEMPFEPVGLGAPTQRPGEPIMQGLGAPSGVTPPADSNNPAVLRLARYLPVLEAAAERKGAAQSLRTFVLSLRSQLPDDLDITQLMGEDDGMVG